MEIKLKSIVKLLRLHHYIKNLLIFMPLFFAGQITNYDLAMKAVLAFVSFSLCASALYIYNDIQDIEEDRQHPKKKYRPIAAGNISIKSASVLALVLFTISVFLMMGLSLQALGILGGYFILNVGYTFFFKHIALLDVTIISIGFVLRLFIGSQITSIYLSMWMVMLTFLLAQFLALAKRRDDMIIFLNSGKKMRKVIDGYNLKFIDNSMVFMASVVIVSYILYTTSTEVVTRLQTDYLYLTVLFVILGIMRYMQIAFVEENSGSPTKVLLKDVFMQITILAWLITFTLIIYF